MTTVFIGGSRHVSRLDTEVANRIDKIIAQDFGILVGDANGADKAVQLYLHRQNYRNVVVFCTEGACRNNVGSWELRSVAAATRERNAEFYSAKDRVMAKEATIGLMLWDGKSIGTLMNVYRLLNLQKKAVVYAVAENAFIEFRSSEEWDQFVINCDRGIREKLRQRASLEVPSTMERNRQQSLFEPS